MQTKITCTTSRNQFTFHLVRRCALGDRPCLKMRLISNASNFFQVKNVFAWAVRPTPENLEYLGIYEAHGFKLRMRLRLIVWLAAKQWNFIVGYPVAAAIYFNLSIITLLLVIPLARLAKTLGQLRKPLIRNALWRSAWPIRHRIDGWSGLCLIFGSTRLSTEVTPGGLKCDYTVVTTRSIETWLSFEADN